jgi:hypothetical protein
MKYARIVDFIVFEVFIPPAGFELTDCFTPEVASQFSLCADDIQGGWVVHADGNITPPPPPPEPTEPPLPAVETP